MSMHKRSGAALITVMVVVFIVMAIIANLSVTDFRVIKRLSNRQQIEQASTMALSAVAFGRAGLGTSGATSGFDSLNDVWAQPIPKTKLLEETYMSGYIIDEQSKFNINDLVTTNGQVNQVVLTQFTSLLSNINLPQSMAANIASYMAAPQYQSDIMQQYTQGKPAYRPAGRPLLDLSELILVKGITPPMVLKMAQYVTAIPVNGAGLMNESANESSPQPPVPAANQAQGSGMTVNVNTASAEVIAAKSGIQLPVAQRLLSYRATNAFESTGQIKTFLTQNGVQDKQANGTPLNLAGLGTTSSYFTIHVQIDVHEDQFRWIALVFRQNRSGQWPQILWQHPE
ncbi:MAG: type II secretion system minor pseudopilin GspK [Burkholderiales bacterium]|nr:type II secretion system minor pseudopilin GspK [Burkholderiales bacterium]